MFSSIEIWFGCTWHIETNKQMRKTKAVFIVLTGLKVQSVTFHMFNLQQRWQRKMSLIDTGHTWTNIVNYLLQWCHWADFPCFTALHHIYHVYIIYIHHIYSHTALNTEFRIGDVTLLLTINIKESSNQEKTAVTHGHSRSTLKNSL